MPRSSPLASRLVALAVLAVAASAWAGPETMKVGGTRVVFSAKGAVLRADASDTAAPVGTLPKNTAVKVLEIKLPFAKVEGAPGAGRPPISGWLRAYQAEDPAVVAAPPPTPMLNASGATRVDARDAAAAGRRFDAATERGFRAKRGDLARGYQLVEELERTTAQDDSSAAVEFLVEGAVGRPGTDYRLPDLLPPTPPPPDKPKREIPGGLKEKAEDLLGGLLGGKKVGKAVARGLVEFGSGAVEAQWEQLNTKYTPDNEYYLGRAVAASAYARYGAEPNPALRAYVRRVGDAIVRAAPPGRVPANHGGYHFDVLNSDEVNGISGPGGFVFVTRGAVLACATEDEVAGILAHELAHSTLHHGEQVLRASKEHQERMKRGASVAAAILDVKDTKFGDLLVNVFGETVGQMARTSMEHAYGSRLEYDADLEGSYILYDVWYDWWALRGVLSRMTDSHGGADHASPQQRAAFLDPRLGPLGAFTPRDWLRPYRLGRFNEALGRAPPAPAAPPAGPPPGPPAPPAGLPPAR